MNLSHVLRDIAGQHPFGDPKELAGDVLDSLSREDLAVLVAEEIAHHQRALARDAERAAFLGDFLGEVDVAKKIKPLGEFALGNKESVEWRFATIGQHQQRIDFLRRMRDGIDATIARHQNAIRKIEAHGATCLADIDGEAW